MQITANLKMYSKIVGKNLKNKYAIAIKPTTSKNITHHP